MKSRCRLLVWSFIIVFAITSRGYSEERKIIGNNKNINSSIKLYWFIPDGLRAEPYLFNIFEWAEKGELPNIKKMMENGSYGYSIPTFPSHTPTNFATLFTGTNPDKHGIADGPMHIEGYPLDRVSCPGFASYSKKVPPIWKYMEKIGKKTVLLSIPGSTPPEIDIGTVIRGRWGGWGADFHSMIFEDKKDSLLKKFGVKRYKLFFAGPKLTEFIDRTVPKNWSIHLPKSYSSPFEIVMRAWSGTIYGYVFDSTDDGIKNYDRVLLSIDKERTLEILGEGEWGEWHKIDLKWKGLTVHSDFRIKIIKMTDSGFLRIRCLFNNLNEYITEPPQIAKVLQKHVGAMVDFVDNFPPQLIYYEEDKDTFIEEMNFSFDWHRRAVDFLLRVEHPDVFINDIYSPNQMLTSRWWMGYIDPAGLHYNDIDENKRAELWKEILSMYKKVDAILGELLKHADENTVIVFSSDHGAAPLNKEIRINNILAKAGLLKFKRNDATGEIEIDWKNTKAVFLKMDGIYINPKGLAGNYKRASGKEYELLRAKVRKLLLNLQDKNGQHPIIGVFKWEEAKDYLELPPDRIGDLVIANDAGYGFSEEVTEDLSVFSYPLKTGYKQAIFADTTYSMWTPFIIMGKGIRKNYKIKRPLFHRDQYPTILKAMGLNIPSFVEGRVLNEIFE